MEAPIIYTIGHSNKTGGEFVNKLLQNGIEVLVDVRTYPMSRYNPQFNQRELQIALGNVGINYEWRGKNLGGKGENEYFYETIDQIVRLAEKKKVCVMCSEGDPAQCHRTTMLRPAILTAGGVVNDLLWKPSKPSKPKPASLF